MLFQREFSELFIDFTEINVRIRWLDSNIKLVDVLKDNKTVKYFLLEKIITN